MRSVTCGQPYSAWRRPRASASASRPRVSRTASTRSDFHGRAGGGPVAPHRPAPTSPSAIGKRSRRLAMRVYTITPDTTKVLRASADDLTGSKLPQSHGPWTATGAIGPDNDPPHIFSRAAVEQAIDTEGVQLW